MIKSMTGFGLASNEIGNIKISVELKSLNSKFLEVSLKIPKAYSEKELYLRNLCNKEIERGKVSISINVDRSNDSFRGAIIDQVIFKNYYHQLVSLSQELGAETANLFPTILNLPEVVTFNETKVDENENQLLLQTFQVALKNFNQFREDEGNILQKDLELRVTNILNYFLEIEKLAPLRIPLIKARLTQFLEDAVGKINVDQNRFEQEIIFYIDKLDITEEQTRLKSHCNYFIKTLESKDANGKKLGFIAQEMGREINTIGSKANDAEMQKMVVGMKEELEKIKEQLLNVL